MAAFPHRYRHPLYHSCACSWLPFADLTITRRCGTDWLSNQTYGKIFGLVHFRQEEFIIGTKRTVGGMFPPKRKPAGRIALRIILAVAEHVLKNDSLGRLIQRFAIPPSASDENVSSMHCARYGRRLSPNLREGARRCRCCCPIRGGLHLYYESIPTHPFSDRLSERFHTKN